MIPVIPCSTWEDCSSSACPSLQSPISATTRSLILASSISQHRRRPNIGRQATLRLPICGHRTCRGSQVDEETYLQKDRRQQGFKRFLGPSGGQIFCDEKGIIAAKPFGP